MKKTIGLVVFYIVSLLIQGCVGAAATGANLAYNHYQIESSLNDRYIAIEIEEALYAVPDVHENTNISVATFDKMVLLTGEARTKELRKQVIALAKSVPNIKHLYSFIQIGGPLPVTTDLNDTFITAKVKAHLIATRSLDASNIKVITRNGTTYMLGKVNKEQSATTIKIARATQGVRGVVTMFEYVHTTLYPFQQEA